ncbi:putative natriuretic peptides receptor, partial [Ixodes scapularis]
LERSLRFGLMKPLKQHQEREVKQFAFFYIVARVITPEDPPFRPVVDRDACISELHQLMTRCWAEDPDERPTFNHIKVMMRVINRGYHGEVNIMDNIMARMEQYANELEVLVEQRTAAFLEEKRKSEELLYQVLP